MTDPVRIGTFACYTASSTAARSCFAEGDYPLIEYNPLRFSLSDVRSALFDSTYRHPITVVFPSADADESIKTDISVTVELVHAIYGLDETDQPLADCYDTPEWYIRGVGLFRTPAGPMRAPVHAFLGVQEDGIQSAVVQVVTDAVLIARRST
jgi:hypothetical protein